MNQPATVNAWILGGLVVGLIVRGPVYVFGEAAVELRITDKAALTAALTEVMGEL